jgi:hypothetical protein
MFVHSARVLLCTNSPKLGGVGIFSSEKRRIFSDMSEIPTTLELEFYVRARRASKESSTTRWVMAIKVMLSILFVHAL